MRRKEFVVLAAAPYVQTAPVADATDALGLLGNPNARAHNLTGWRRLWKRLPIYSTVDEVIQNFFIRQPILWT